MDNSSLAHTKWDCKYHLVFAPKYRRKIIYKDIKADVGLMPKKRDRDNRGTMYARSYPYAGKHSA